MRFFYQHVPEIPEQPSIYDLYESGDIKIHNGTLDDIPKGWALCDGQNGTPRICDRAVAGAGGKYVQNEEFGEDTQRPTKPSVSVSVSNHTLSNSRIPSHNHSIGLSTVGGTTAKKYAGGSAYNQDKYSDYTRNQGSSGAHNHGASVSVGDVGEINTQQKSIALIWIMKL